MHALLAPLLAGALLLLGAAGADRPAAVPEAEVEAAVAPTGYWTITLTSSKGTQVDGTMTIRPDGSGHIRVPSRRLDAPIRDGHIEDRGGAFTWTGALGTPIGRFDFQLAGHVNGDRLTGESEVQHLGTFSVEALRDRSPGR